MHEFIERLVQGWETKGFLKFGLLIIAGLFFGYFLLWGIIMFIRRKNPVLADSIARRLPNAFYLIVLILFINFTLPVVDMLGWADITYKKNLTIILTVAVSWFLIKTINVLEDLLLHKYQSDLDQSDADASHNISRRKVKTQLQFFKKLIISFIVLIAVAIILMKFAAIREVGTSLLASAGILGVLIGLAAQKSLTNILAGLQIAFTQPFKIDDLVVIDDYWGRIEEINLAYVVVRIYDKRRLVLPITYFTENTFENWTKNSAHILGEVFFHVDYKVPVRELRNQLKYILDSTVYWDKQAWSLQVTDLTDRTVILRALMSSNDASQTWELKCFVREKMLEYLQENYPEVLPRVRAVLSNEDAATEQFPVHSARNTDEDEQQSMSSGYDSGH